ncbi:MAG: hypothetical protein WKG03_01575 [Telluria sp.]
MPYLSRTARFSLVTAALAASLLASIAQAAPAAKAKSPRVTIESMARSFKVPAASIVYIGLDGKPMTQAAFYRALETNPAQKWEGAGTMARSSTTPDLPNKFEGRLVRSDK